LTLDNNPQRKPVKCQELTPDPTSGRALCELPVMVRPSVNKAGPPYFGLTLADVARGGELF